ncbi:unnamed protein product [Thlaspi arvense]|uniref:FKB95-like N-terminal Kelch domain-containing protein n=1 Tax=Thlaspi arvense TaxID=13288 RepID=A0AAU9SB19_THLAR|nr:unnamed protein product [Thlaspi arvense]
MIFSQLSGPVTTKPKGSKPIEKKSNPKNPKTMSTAAASSTNEPPRTNNEHPQSPPSSSSFSSLPNDILKPYSVAIMVGPEIYFLGGYYNHPSRDMWILDSRSGKRSQAVGLVDEKIYAFGRYEEEDEEIKADVFDTKTQTWEVAEVAPVFNVEWSCLWMSVVSPSLDKKVYVRKSAQVIVYDPRDGNCEKIDIPNDHLFGYDVCVIDNMLYIYCSYVGLMWYDSKEKY